MARVALPQSKVRARRRRRRIIILSLAAGALLLLLGGVIWLAHAPFMRITAVQVSGQTTLNATDVANRVLADISGSYLYLFPRDNIFLYPKYKTEVALSAQVPTIAKVSINAKDFHTLSVVVTERARKALWCDASFTTEELCFWLDQDGVAYADEHQGFSVEIASTSYERYYGPLPDGVLPLQFLNTDQFHALSALVDALAQNQAGNPIQSIKVHSVNEVRVTFADNFVLIFSLSAPGADVYQRFLLILKSDAFAGHVLSDFEYLDMRFGDKIYYKLRNSKTPATSN